MRDFEKIQKKLSAYTDALYFYFDCCDEPDTKILDLENSLLDIRPIAYWGIADGISSLIEYVRSQREEQQQIDIDYVDGVFSELFYLCSMADQGTLVAPVEYYQRIDDEPKTEPPIDTELEAPKEQIKISNMSRGVRYIYENNPYCVLGIACNSTRSEALKIRDKLQKYSHLGAESAYVSPFDLANVEKPNRELGRIQVVLENISDISNRWLWLREANYYVDAWDTFKTYHPDNDTFDYDKMITVYLSLLLTDAGMSSKSNWHSLLTAIDMLCLKEDYQLYEIIKFSLPASEIDKYNYRMIASSFRSTVLTPIIMNIESAQGYGLMSILTYFKDSKYSFSETLLDKATSSAFIWAYNRIDPVFNATRAVAKGSSPTRIQTEAIETAIDTYFDNDYNIVQSFSATLLGVDFYTERINDRIRSVVWDATNILSCGGKKAKACKYDCIIYPFCSESQQKEIKRYYPYEMQSLPDSAYSVDECKEAAKTFKSNHDEKNWFIWLLKAAEKGDSVSQVEVGTAYALGQGVSKSEIKAVWWYEKAAAQGDGYALSNMAIRHYNGNPPCRKDLAKAMEYWIRAVVALHRKEDIEQLNNKFCGWQTSSHPLLQFTGDDWEYKLRPMAELGIPSAEYWLGHHMYTGKNGCIRDVNASRRWLLLASAHGNLLAEIPLNIWFNLNVKEACSPFDMFNCGAKYARLDGEQNRDLAFYWYYRAYHSGYKEGANNLGVCYNVGKGTSVNYEIANQYYLIGISQNNSGSYYNYGYNLYYGHGVTKDIDKSRQHLLKAKELGSESANAFLREHFGISQVEYKSFDSVWFTHRDGISLSFDKIQVVPDGIKLTFWGKNTNSTPRAFWIEYYTVDGVRTEEWNKLIELKTGECGFFSFVITEKYQVNRITVGFEIDQEGTRKVFSFPELVVSLSNNTGDVTAYISNLSPPYVPVSTDEYEDELDDFEDISFAIYDKDGLHIEFCQFEEDNGNIYMSFWSNNESTRDVKLWARKVNVDGDKDCEIQNIGTVKAGTDEWCKIILNNISSDGYYTVDCYIEIDDLHNNELDRTQRISVDVDFDDYTQSAELIEDDEYEDEDEYGDEEVEFVDISFAIYDKNGLHIEYCKFKEINGSIYMCFWANNESSRDVKFWIRDVNVDGEQDSDLENIGTIKSGDSSWCELRLKDIFPHGSYTIDCYIEIDDLRNKELDRTQRISVDVDFDDYTQSAELIEDDEYEDEDEEVEFDDIEFVAYDNDDVYVEFCNFEIENDKAYFNFWVRNDSDQIIQVYAQEIYVDGNQVSDYKEIGEFEPGEADYGRFYLNEVTPNTYYQIKTFIEIDDEESDFIDSGDTFIIDVDFDDGTLTAEIDW